MAFLTKRGKYYYVKWNTSQNGKIRAVRKALGTRHKDVAQKMVTELEKLESLGKIDPFSSGFNPKRALADDKPDKTVQCATVTDALNLFYSAKQHLSPATVDAYKRALDHFVELNGLDKASPKSIRPHHFENVIFKRGITAATRHYYFRHFRSWWKFLKKKKVVEADIFDSLKEDLPRIRENTRPKMISEDELKTLFKTFDSELKRKKTLPEFDPERVQHWFKPIVALYFYGGLRKHEAGYSPELKYSGLKGENLIYEDGELTYIYLPPTKGRKERQIPIIKELRVHLEDYLKQRGTVKQKDFVFVYKGGTSDGLPVRGDRVYREFKRYAKVAGIPTTRSLHGMRHQAVTTWIEKGFHTAEASYMAGHSSQKVTEKYTHLTAKRLKEKMDGLI
ncbi:tyrosine-type recombinase/integrase [Rhodohalobacter halophilus]|uniref:tyrosine-type recombinase/integrase n=1 Tax=Rhodohalobacter halophilus TaxID=1812810 RepID=UPI00083FD3F6|nr:tyrosine-type recombinase/integrase [Rhodohalobacter halophilus]